MLTVEINGLKYKVGNRNKIFAYINDDWRYSSNVDIDEFVRALKSQQHKKIASAEKVINDARRALKAADKLLLELCNA